MDRFAFIKNKKGVWDCVKTANGPWMLYEAHQAAFAEQAKEIATLREKPLFKEAYELLVEDHRKVCQKVMQVKQAYNTLMAQAVKFAEMARRDLVCTYGGYEEAEAVSPNYRDIKAFLTTPEVSEFQRQKEGR